MVEKRTQYKLALAAFFGAAAGIAVSILLDRMFGTVITLSAALGWICAGAGAAYILDLLVLTLFCRRGGGAEDADRPRVTGSPYSLAITVAVIISVRSFYLNRDHWLSAVLSSAAAFLVTLAVSALLNRSRRGQERT